MDRYDLIVIGAGTSGAYLAQRMARRGHRVLVLEQASKETVGTKYDIFHIEQREFSRLEIPRPKEGDAAWAFEFEKNYNADPLTKFPKCQMNPMVGLHMHDYTLLLDELAEKAGAEIRYGARFLDFLFDEAGKICGVKAEEAGEETAFGARIVADCSGMAAAGRTKLPADYGVETAALTDEDMFYVVLRYVTLNDPKDYLDGSTFWAYYKSWIAPCADPHGAIIGIGACHSFDYAEQVFAEMEQTVPLPPYTLDHIERGRTPYTRNPRQFPCVGRRRQSYQIGQRRGRHVVDGAASNCNGGARPRAQARRHVTPRAVGYQSQIQPHPGRGVRDAARTAGGCRQCGKL